MKILSLVSSYRTDGNTNRIVALIEKQLLSIANKENVALEIERIQLAHLDISPCRGCRVCFNMGEEKCPLKDDLLSIRDKILQSDGILAASPVYVEDVNGIMKNWIDRMAFNCHRPAFAGKKAYIVTTSGGGSTDHAVNTIKNAFNTWGINFVGRKRFRTGELMNSSEIEIKYRIEIEKTAEALFESVKNKAAKSPSLYSLIAFKIQQKYWQKKEESMQTKDYTYWKGNGWLDSNCNYYIPNKANFFKIKFARFIGGIAAVFFI